MERALNHDEHQFLVPGTLYAAEGLLPYRDYALFHLPNLVFAYAAVDRLVGDPILGPKFLSFAATWLTAGVILWVGIRRTQGDALTRLAVGASLLTLLLLDPLFIFTAGKTWNHEVPTFLLLLAVLFHVESFRRISLAFMVLSGLSCGLAVGCRLTFAPCLLPLVGAAFFFPSDPRRRWTMPATFTAAVTVAMTPSLYFLITSPEPFLFGNLEFPRLRLLDPENTRIRKTMTLWRKLRYFGKEVMLPSWPVFVAFLSFAISPIRRRLDGSSGDQSTSLVIAVALFLLVGCFLPSRYQYQHFFAFTPFLLLGIALSGIGSANGIRNRHGGVILLLVLAATSTVIAVCKGGKGENQASFNLQLLQDRTDWFSTEAQEFGVELRHHVPTGRILTLSPAWPIAAGIQVYPEFATGPFAWRSASFVAAERRSHLHIVAPADLEAFLAGNPPAGILTGVEDDDLEKPLIAYAKAHGFQEVKVSHKRELWLPEKAR